MSSVHHRRARVNLFIHSFVRSMFASFYISAFVLWRLRSWLSYVLFKPTVDIAARRPLELRYLQQRIPQQIMMKMDQRPATISQNRETVFDTKNNENNFNQIDSKRMAHMGCTKCHRRRMYMLTMLTNRKRNGYPLHPRHVIIVSLFADNIKCR